MKNLVSKLKLQAIIACLLLAVVMSSCMFTPYYYIEQDITDSYIYSGCFLKTLVWHNGKIIFYQKDEITLNTQYTIKCFRYKEAEIFINKCKSIDTGCNNR